MRTWNVAAGAAAIAAAVVALTGTARAMHHEVKVASGKEGSYLTDTEGKALYTFKKDTPGKSACAGDCVKKWPVYFREKVGVTGDLQASDFESITRDDGAKQTTYKGKPLYYFAQDKAPGDTKGQGVAGVWSLAQP